MTDSIWDIPENTNQPVEKAAQVFLNYEQAQSKRGQVYYKFEFTFEGVDGRDSAFKTNTFDQGFQKILQPSLKALFPADPSKIHEKFVLYQWETWKDYGRSSVQYALDNGREVLTDEKGRDYTEKPCVKFLRVFKDENEALEYHDENLVGGADDSVASPADDIPLEPKAAVNGMTKEVALNFIAPLVNQSKDVHGMVDKEALAGNLKNIMGDLFTIDSPEVQAAITAAQAEPVL